MAALLEMRGIAKSYGAVRANVGIDLTVQAGSIVGLLGENGSGKSTLMKILSIRNSNDLFKPDRPWVNPTPPHGPGLAHPSTA